MDICQYRLRYNFLRSVGLALAALLLAALAGCVHLREHTAQWPSEPSLSQRHAPAVEPAHHLALSLAVAALALVSLGWSWARRRRLARQSLAAAGQGRAASLDREDLALIRTARDALSFLVRKQLARFKVVALADFRRRRGGAGRAGG